ncbi:hypothetical protein FRC06_001402 [Ceratobasidium sp. 370]|nr:hypothetical protein FRC06_001402 [Ceratobasidium sp. 370]
MALMRGIGAIPESTNPKDYDYQDGTFNEEIAEAFVADDDTELFEHDDEEKINPLVNLQSGISKIHKIAKIIRSSPQCMELFTAIVQLIEDGNERAAKEQKQLWNSLLFMLEQAKEYREAIDALTTHLKIKIYCPYALSADDWATVLQSTYDSEYYYYAMVLDPQYKDTLFRANSPLLEELFSKEWVSDCANTLLKELQPKSVTVGDIHDFESAFKASIPQRSGQSFRTWTVSKKIADYFSEDVIPEGKSLLT